MQCNMFGEWDPDAEGQLLQRQARSVRCQRNFAVIFAIFGEGYISAFSFLNQLSVLVLRTIISIMIGAKKILKVCVLMF